MGNDASWVTVVDVCRESLVRARVWARGRSKVILLHLAQTQHLSSPREQHPHSEAWWWQHLAVGMFIIAGTGKLVRIEGMMDGSKYRKIIERNLLQSSRDLRLERRFTFQQDNNPKHTAKAILEWLQRETFKYL